MNTLDIAGRLQALEDDLALRTLAARFSDAVNERDVEAFKAIWSEDGVWEIGPPFHLKAHGRAAIGQMFEALWKPKVMFFQLTHSGVLSFTGPDTASGRWAERERGKGEADYYDNLAVYHDRYVRTDDGWRFQSRFYDYRFLDMSPFAGDTFAETAPPAG